MSYFAAAAVLGPQGWAVSDVDLKGVADVEDAAERLRDVDPEASTSLLFVESEDEYLVVLRLDDGEDLRVFGSDAGFAEESVLGEALLGDLESDTDLPIEDDLENLDEDEAADGELDDDTLAEDPALPAEVAEEPVGDADLLVDLGVPAARLLELCAAEGMLPSDVTAVVAEQLGVADALEEIRPA